MRQNLWRLTLVDIVHDADTCVSCPACAASLWADPRPVRAAHRESADAHARDRPCVSMDAKGASPIRQGPASDDHQTHTLSRPSRHLSRYRSHRAPAAVLGTDELPRLRGVRGWLCTRCHCRDVALLGAWRSRQSSVFVLLCAEGSLLEGAVKQPCACYLQASVAAPRGFEAAHAVGQVLEQPLWA